MAAKKKKKVPTRGGPGRGQGRKPDGDEALSVAKSLRLSPSVASLAEQLMLQRNMSFNELINRLVKKEGEGLAPKPAKPRARKAA